MTDPAPPLEILKTAAAGPDLGTLLADYQQNFNMNLIRFIIYTVIQVGVLYFVLAGSGITEIAKNWPKYRCNPAIMPFASLYGYDASENFNYCMKNIFSTNAGAVLGPLYAIMANFTDIVGTVSNVANSFRFLIANLLHGMERMISSFRDRFRDILFSIRTSFLKIQSLMGRVYATFYAVVFMGLSALKAADNVANNDVVKFIMEFCFPPDTPIAMADGSSRPLSTIRIGDRLAAVKGVHPIVTSLFEFDGAKTKMVRFPSSGVVVSGQHFVFYDSLGIWLEADHHPDVVPAPSVPKLLCLNTSTHVLRVGEHIFSDYDETSESEVLFEAQSLSLKMLNRRIYRAPSPNEKNYSLGIEGMAAIRMKDGSVKRLCEIRVGDVIHMGGVVLGTVREAVSEAVNIPGIVRDRVVSASQLLWDKENHEWRRAAELYPDRVTVLSRPYILYQLITANNVIESEGQVYRDYREVSDPDMEEPYSTHLHKKLNERMDVHGISTK
jgi:hypothetical protein